MTVSEQLSIWASSSSGDILVGITYDAEPVVIERMKARDALAAFERVTGKAPDRVMQAAWSRAAIVGFERRHSEINVARVAELGGVTCVIVEGRIPNGPHAAYRAVFSSAETFL
jgi:hypothetical protein